MTADTDLDAFRLGDAPSMAEVVERNTSGRRWPKVTRPKGEDFLRGPIPWDWISRAAILPGAALPVGLVIWRTAFLKNTLDVKLTSASLKAVGVTRMSKMRALKELEAAGLVEVQRTHGKNPLVGIVDKPVKGGLPVSETESKAKADGAKLAKAKAKPKKAWPPKAKSEPKPEMEISAKAKAAAKTPKPLKRTVSGDPEPMRSRAKLVQLSLLNN